MQKSSTQSLSSSAEPQVHTSQDTAGYLSKLFVLTALLISFVPSGLQAITLSFSPDDAGRLFDDSGSQQFINGVGITLAPEGNNGQNLAAIYDTTAGGGEDSDLEGPYTEGNAVDGSGGSLFGSVGALLILQEYATPGEVSSGRLSLATGQSVLGQNADGTQVAAFDDDTGNGSVEPGTTAGSGSLTMNAPDDGGSGGFIVVTFDQPLSSYQTLLVDVEIAGSDNGTPSDLNDDIGARLVFRDLDRSLPPSDPNYVISENVFFITAASLSAPGLGNGTGVLENNSLNITPVLNAADFGMVEFDQIDVRFGTNSGGIAFIEATLANPEDNHAIGSTVFEDLNGNNLQEAGEPGVSGVTVNLLAAVGGGVLESVVTDANGSYLFDGLAPGQYQVCLPGSQRVANGALDPAIYTLVTAGADGAGGFDNSDNDFDGNSDGTFFDLDGDSSTLDDICSPVITLSPNTELTNANGEIFSLDGGQDDSLPGGDDNGNMTVDFGFSTPLASIGNLAFFDNNGNDVFDGGDTPVSGVLFELTDTAGNPISGFSAVSGPDGIWAIGAIPAGDYRVKVSSNNPDLVLVAQGGNPSADNDSTYGENGITGANIGEGETMGFAPIFTVTAGSTNPTLDAGFELAPGSVATTFDFGDAPDVYFTTLGNSGARHELSSTLQLGDTVDAETDGNSSPDAQGDGSDEDGITFPDGTQIPANASTFVTKAVVTAPGTTTQMTTFTVDDDFSSNSFAGGNNWNGPWVDVDANGVGAASGRVRALNEQLELRNGNGDMATRAFTIPANATDAELVINYDTIGTFNGAFTVQVTGNGNVQSFSLPQANTSFTQDLTTFVPAAGGNIEIKFNTSGAGSISDTEGYNIADLTVTATVTEVIGLEPTLIAWIDFDQSGSFDADEAVEVPGADLVTDGSTENMVMWNDIDTAGLIPSGAAGTTYARFRVSTDPALTINSPGGLVGDGEVEDYQVFLGESVGLGNLVFMDNNGDGVFGAGDMGIPNVTVNVYDSADTSFSTILGTDLTDTDGRWEVTGLVPGNYVAVIPATEFQAGGDLVGKVSIPGNGSDTGTSPVSDEDTDENGIDNNDPANNGIVTPAITLGANGEPSGETAPAGADDDNFDGTVDFGFVNSVGLGNLVFMDVNGDGNFDAGTDMGVENVTVNVYAASDANFSTILGTAETDADGRWEVTGLTPGAYVAQIPADEFQTGGDLAGKVSVPGSGDDTGVSPVSDEATDENGIDDPAPEVNGITSAPIDLSDGSEPTGETAPAGGNDDNFDGTVDFGFTESSLGIGNLVFNDTDGDGNFDSTTEAGIDGVIVELYTSTQTPGSDTPVATTTTADGGCYYFSGLADGDYIIFIPASEFGSGEPLENLLSSPGNDTDSGLDDSVNENGVDELLPASNGVQTVAITLNEGDEASADESGKDGDSDNGSDLDNDLTVDLGFTAATGGLGNLVFSDLNNNGIFDSGPEAGIDGVTVELYLSTQTPGSDTPLATTVTADGGCYLFSGLSDGDYLVYIPATEFNGSAPLAGLLSSSGQTTSVTSDDNAGENGAVSGVGPEAATGVVSNTISLQAGSAPVEPSGAKGATDDGADNSATDLANDLTVDFGFTNTVGLGNLVFMDNNGDGVFGAGDMGIEDVTVDVYAATDTSFSTILGTDTTDGNGRWEVTGLASGSYVALIPATEFQTGGDLLGKISIPGNGGDTGTSPVSDETTDENGIDNNDPATNGIVTPTITLGANAEPTGETAPAGSDDNNFDGTVDFGFVNSVGLGNLVFMDVNNDGNFDAGTDMGIENVTVNIYAASDTNFTTILGSDETDSDGRWAVTGLVPGNYVALIPATEFQTGGQLIGKTSITGNGADTGTSPVSDEATDENGIDDANPSVNGIATPTISLANNAEPTGETAPAGADDNNFDGTVDFGFVDSGAIGNLVFLDLNGNGIFEPALESGINGVEVELYLSTQTPGTDTPIATTTTANGGCYLFDGLSNGDYIIFIPESEFAPNGDLAGLSSSDGQDSSATNDDSAGENGVVAGAGPEASTGVVSNTITLTIGSAPVEPSAAKGATDDGPDNSESDLASNLTVDFGFTGKAATFQDFAVANAAALGLDDNTDVNGAAPGIPANDPFTGEVNTGVTDVNNDDLAGLDDNPDQDAFNNLAEFALCFDPGSGTKTTPDGAINEGFHVELDGSAVDASFIRPIGADTQVTYTLQSYDGTSWSDVSGVTLATSDNGDGTETVTFEAINTAAAAGLNKGLVRLQLSAGGVTTVTSVQGYQLATVRNFCQTYSDPLLTTCVFTGTVTGAPSAQVVNLSGSTVSQPLTAVLDPNTDYYLEVTSGSSVGHVFDIDSFNATSVTIAADSDLCALAAPYNTLTQVPATLDGASVVIRAHKTIGELFPRGGGTFVEGTGISDAGQIIRLNRAATGNDSPLVFYYADANQDEWVNNDGGATATDEILPPGEAVFVHNADSLASFQILQIGEVRTNQLAVPLKEGYNFVAPAHAVIDQTLNSGALDSRQLNDSTTDAQTSGSKFTFVGDGARSRSDFIEVWRDDSVTAAADAHLCYDAIFYAVFDSINQWTQGGRNFGNDNNSAVFECTRGMIYRIYQNDKLDYYIPSPIQNN